MNEDLLGIEDQKSGCSADYPEENCFEYIYRTNHAETGNLKDLGFDYGSESSELKSLV